MGERGKIEGWRKEGGMRGREDERERCWDGGKEGGREGGEKEEGGEERKGG